MFCQYCCKEIPEGAAFCPNCGTPTGESGSRDPFKEHVQQAKENASAAADDLKEKASAAAGDFKEKASAAADEFQKKATEAVNQAGQSIDSAVDEVTNDLRGITPVGGPLKADRSLIAYILLSIITCGIYGYYFIYTVARDVNTACDDDDEETPGLGIFILLSFVTCGFYGLYWEYKLANRLQKNAPAFDITIEENGTTILLWRLLGALVCGIGTFIGSYLLIRNINRICEAYNRKKFGNAIVSAN